MSNAQELTNLIDGAFAMAEKLRPGWGLEQYLREKGEEITGPAPSKLVSIGKVCEMLSVSRTYLWQLVKRGALPTVRLGKRRLFCLADIE